MNDAPGPVLFDRLREHAVSIEATDLNLEDFRCRYLVSDDIWIPLGESLLIAQFQPLWNVLIEGFGIHTPGAGRRRQARSKWDTLHPGRAWAAKLPANAATHQELERTVAEFFAGRVQPAISPEQAVTEEEGDE